MPFPPTEIQEAFADYLSVQVIIRHVETRRSDLVKHLRQVEGRPMVGLELPDGRQVLCAKTTVGYVEGWVCMTPSSTDEQVRATMGSSLEQLAQMMTESYDQFAGTGSGNPAD